MLGTQIDKGERNPYLATDCSVYGTTFECGVIDPQFSGGKRIGYVTGDVPNIDVLKNLFAGCDSIIVDSHGPTIADHMDRVRKDRRNEYDRFQAIERECEKVLADRKALVAAIQTPQDRDRTYIYARVLRDHGEILSDLDEDTLWKIERSYGQYVSPVLVSKIGQDSTRSLESLIELAGSTTVIRIEDIMPMLRERIATRDLATIVLDERCAEYPYILLELLAKHGAIVKRSLIDQIESIANSISPYDDYQSEAVGLVEMLQSYVV
jgi:hypothetical protein